LHGGESCDSGNRFCIKTTTRQRIGGRTPS
jgi:hypothetical protein